MLGGNTGKAVAGVLKTVAAAARCSIEIHRNKS